MKDIDSIRGNNGPSEFEPDPYFVKLFSKHNLELGRMIFSDKAAYCKKHQGDFVIFNANVITKKHKKIWYGDLNVTLDFYNLKNIADELNEDLYILMEGDARFGYEKQDVEILMKKARTSINCNKSIKKQKKKR